MEQLFLEFHNQVKERIAKFNNFYSFGEDSVRYDFYYTVLNLYGLKPTDIILEQPIPSIQFTAKERDLTILKQGRHIDKPEFDLRIDSNKLLEHGILAEFAFFRKTEISDNQDKSARHGKIMNEIHRLALLKNYKNLDNNPVYNDFSNYKCLLICITDFEMIDYGLGSRGRKAIPVQDYYRLNTEYLDKFPKTITDCIDEKFLNKVRSLEIIPTAKRIFNKIENATYVTPKWATWVWEISYEKYV